MKLKTMWLFSLATAILLNGCAKPTPSEVQDARFDLPNNYEQMVKSLVNSRIGFVEDIYVYQPSEDCKTGIFSVNCSYRGAGNVSYLNGYWLIQGRKVLMRKNFTYKIEKNHRVSIY